MSKVACHFASGPASSSWSNIRAPTSRWMEKDLSGRFTAMMSWAFRWPIAFRNLHHVLVSLSRRRRYPLTGIPCGTVPGGRLDLPPQSPQQTQLGGIQSQLLGKLKQFLSYGTGVQKGNDLEKRSCWFVKLGKRHVPD